MKTPWSFRRSLLVVATLLLLTVLGQPQTVVAQRMTDGQDGVAGDPATDGENGEHGFRLGGYYRTGSEIPFSLGTRSGGHGGDGGDGNDGDDSDSDAAAGHGGDGGNGGLLSLTVEPGSSSRRVYHWISGNGGNGGRGGSSDGNLINGQGGNGGQGGNIYLDLATTEVFQSQITSGRGGNAWGNTSGQSGIQTYAGSGGNIDTSFELDAKGQYVPYGFVHELTSGAGGIGFDFANAGHGGHVTYRSAHLFVDPKNEAFRTQWDLVAGDGGSSYGGIAGAGGTARMQLGNVVVGRGAAPEVVRSFRMNLWGGNGGNALQQSGMVGSAAMGGHAILEGTEGSSFRTFGAPDTRVVASLIGGKGGDGRLAANGSHGGTAIMRNISVDTSHSLATSSSVYFEAILSGGDGGASQMGNGGNGGNAHYDSQTAKVQGVNIDSLIIAEGGSGGSTSGSSNGGNAAVRSIFSFSDTHAGNSRTDLTHQAVGGNAYRGKGGNATVETRNSAAHSLLVDSEAVSGYGLGGQSGTATAISQADMTGTSNQFGTVAISEATVGNLANVVDQRAGLAYAESTARSDGGWSTLARATAQGGKALDFGNGATSRSYVYAAGEQLAEARSYSLSRQALNIDRRRASVAEANVVAPDADGRAISVADAEGRTSEARSFASIQSKTAAAIATSRANWGASGRGASLITSLQQLDANDSGESMSVYSGMEAGQFLNDIEYGSPTRTFAAVRGGNDSLVNIETTSLATELDFSSPQSYTFLAGDFRLGTNGIAAEVNSELSYHERVAAVDSENHFHAFFYDFESTGGGFDQFSIELDILGTNYLSETFTDEALAIAALESLNIDAGLRGLDSTIFYGLTIHSTHQANQSFEFKFGFGEYGPSVGPQSLSGRNSFNAVPEPNGILFLLAASCVMFLLRRELRPTGTSPVSKQNCHTPIANLIR